LNNRQTRKMPSKTYESALTTIECPREDHIPAIRCPITGMVVSLGFGPEQDPDQDEPVTPSDDGCPTLMFRFHYEIGLEYLHPELAATIAEKRKQLIAAAEHEDDLDDFEIISEHLEDLGQAPLIIDMPTAGLPGDGVMVGLDLARALPRK